MLLISLLLSSFLRAQIAAPLTNGESSFKLSNASFDKDLLSELPIAINTFLIKRFLPILLIGDDDLILIVLIILDLLLFC